MERARNVNDICLVRVAQFVLNVSSQYDTFGRSLLHAAQLIQPENLKIPKDTNNYDQSKRFWDVVHTLALSFRRTARFYKTKLYEPLQSAIEEDC